MDEERLEALLDRWEEAAEQGRVLTAVELCEDDPELIETVQDQIRLLTATQWMTELTSPQSGSSVRAGSVSAESHGLDHHENHKPALPASNLSTSEFRESLYLVGLLTAEDAKEHEDPANAEIDATPQSLAAELIEQGKLTRYQACAALEEKADQLLVDRYVILDVIGSGGMGVVFKALHKSMDRIVALKMLPAEMVDSDDKIRRFKREMKAAARLSHPNVVAVFDADESSGSHFLAMEYVQGSNLADFVERHGPLSCSQAVRCIAHAALGIQHAHENGVIHRDIKPANLLVSSDGTIKVADMGLAALDASSGLEHLASSLTGGLILGTISYIAPEQATDTNEADGRADIYSLGATLHYLLTGQPPFSEGTAVKTLLAHREMPVPRLRDLREDVPKELDDIFQTMLAKNPEDRFGTMGEVVAALQSLQLPEEHDLHIVADVSVEADTYPVMTTEDATVIWPAIADSPDRRSKTSPRVKLMALICCVALVLGTAFFVRNWTGGENDGRSPSDLTRGERASIEGDSTNSQTGAKADLPVPVGLPTGDHFTNDIGMHFAWVPRGSFSVGGTDDAVDIKQISVPYDFYMAVHEVTQAQWQLVMRNNPSHFARSAAGSAAIESMGDEEIQQLPVENVDWSMCQEFTNALNSFVDNRSGWVYRLPTETEWEFACRGGGAFEDDHYSHDYYFSNPTNSLDAESANTVKSQLARTTVVGSYDANPLGIFDMHGNVQEWCLDLVYLSPRHSSRPRRLSRGGSWASSSCQSSERFFIPATDRHGSYGIRVVLGPPVEVPMPTNSDDAQNNLTSKVPDLGPDMATGFPPPAVAPFTAEEAIKYQTDWAEHLGVPVEKRIPISGADDLTLVLIPPGEFLMGSNEADRLRFMDEARSGDNRGRTDRIPWEAPQHPVQITMPFYLGACEVSQAHWMAVMQTNPSEFQSPAHPVEMVSWNDAAEFVARLNLVNTEEQFRIVLPSEAQWEYACRAGTVSPWALESTETVVADSQDGTRPVGQSTPNAWGLYDMHGNIWEWCRDWFDEDYYSLSPLTDPNGPISGKERVDRGGAWSYTLGHCRSAYRNRSTPTSTANCIGFRIAIQFVEP